MASQKCQKCNTQYVKNTSTVCMSRGLEFCDAINRVIFLKWCVCCVNEVRGVSAVCYEQNELIESSPCAQ